MYVDYEIKHVKHIFIQIFLNVLQMFFTQDTSYNRTNHNSAVVCCIKIDLLSMQPTFIQIDTRLKCNIHPPAAHNTICSTQDRVKMYHYIIIASPYNLYQVLNAFRQIQMFSCIEYLSISLYIISGFVTTGPSTAAISCLVARQLCSEQKTCSQILEVIPKTCGLELGKVQINYLIFLTKLKKCTKWKCTF